MNKSRITNAKFVIGVSLFVGATLLCSSLWATYRALRVTTWPEVDAVVTSCQLSPIKTLEFDQDRMARMVATRRQTFKFSYTVSGHSYSSGRFYASGQPYHVGRHLTARYNPKDPTEANLEPERVASLLWLAHGFWVLSGKERLASRSRP